MDPSFIDSLRSAGGNDLTVLPGIELRSELGGSESVHFIGIFPEDCDLEHVWMTLQVKLHLSTKEVEGRDDLVYSDLKDSATVIRELGGIVTVHAGQKTNSIESIPNNTQKFKQALKADLAREFVDVLEVGRPEDISSYRDIVFPHIGRSLPLITGSDNHDALKYTQTNPCWIKADPTFKGLLQALQEPEDRISIGSEPPKLKLVRENPTHFITNLNVKRNEGSPLTETWFDGTSLALNHDLVAIIGNKGSGKSALADILGLLGNSKLEDHFSFLQADRFRHPKSNKARQFSASIQWGDARESVRNLGDPVRPEEVELVTYLPQSYVEYLCNEIGSTTESALDRALEKVIFAHIPHEERLGTASLRELLTFRTEEIQKAAGQLRVRLQSINEQIVQVESQLKPSHRAALENQLQLKQQELEAHLLLAPPPVDEPTSRSPELTAIATEVEVKSELLKRAEQSKAEATEVRHQQNLKLALIRRLNQRVDNLLDHFKSVSEEFNSDAAELGIDITNVVSLSVNRDPLNNLESSCNAALLEAAKEFDVASDSSAVSRMSALTQEIRDLQAALDEPNAAYQRYRDALNEWETRKEALEGSPETRGSLKALHAQLHDLGELPSRLQQLRLLREDVSKEIYQTLVRIMGVYRSLYLPVQQFIGAHALVKDKLRLGFEVSLVDTGFTAEFLNRINQGVIGSFSGVLDGQTMLANIMKRNTFETEDEAIAFLREILDHLTTDKRSEQPKAVDISNQLKKGNTSQALYDFIFSFSYLSPRYVLRLGDAAPSQLSPGEKGTLLLVFYLLLDPENTPLIIDQPEENLDNQTVFDILVPCIKEAKKRRQVVIVTHNPNLAVVCDAEQVIYTNLDKVGGYKLRYHPGAIENPDINRHLMDVLEGTRPAFTNRKAKYMPHQALD